MESGRRADDEVSPLTVQALPELARALNALRGGRSYADLDRAVNPGTGPRVLPASTVSNLLTGRSVPTRDTMVRFLTACGLGRPDQDPWLAAWQRVATGDACRPDKDRPDRTPQVCRARPRLLGVQAAIRVDPDTDPDDLPTYVPRDLDDDLRSAIGSAATRGGFVLLVGGSSVGKTRTLFEAVSAALPTWWLVHPDGPDDLHRLAAAPAPRTVVWLDELQRYLDAPGGVPAAAVRGLIAAGLVVLATMWPGEFTRRAVGPEPGRPDPYANDRQVLRLAHVVDVPERFSAAERQRAEARAADDRIRVALGAGEVGITQILAAGPDLIRRWENAPEEDCYGRAVITAALDARRVGATAPLTRGYLEAAAPGYLTDPQRAGAPSDWLDRALAYATRLLRGATAALFPVPAGMGRIAGYVPADYLHQHALRVRRTEHLPDPTWQALVDHHHPHDAVRLADNAERRGRHRHAEALSRHTVDTTAEIAPVRKAGLLGECGVHLLAGVLTEQGRVDEAVAVLRQQADAGDRSAARRLVKLLAETGRAQELDDEMAAGTVGAAEQLRRTTRPGRTV